jgi:hypothetical protein
MKSDDKNAIIYITAKSVRFLQHRNYSLFPFSAIQVTVPQVELRSLVIEDFNSAAYDQILSANQFLYEFGFQKILK